MAAEPLPSGRVPSRKHGSTVRFGTLHCGADRFGALKFAVAAR